MGLYFAVLVLVMLVGSLNYANSLGFAVTFTLAAVGLVSMHHTQRNLLRLGIAAVDSMPVFVGDTAQFTLTLANASRTPRHAIRVARGSNGGGKNNAMDTNIVTVAVGGNSVTRIACPAPRRGRLPCPRLRLDSSYPLGLFNAWRWLALDASTLVYPRPDGDLPLPHDQGRGDAQATTHRGDAEFKDHRRYVPGDSPRRIDWKASARSDALIIAQYGATRDATLWLDASALTHLPLERRLSQLARWVLDADGGGWRYGLRLGGAAEIAPATGAAHKRACLEALALHP